MRLMHGGAALLGVFPSPLWEGVRGGGSPRFEFGMVPQSQPPPPPQPSPTRAHKGEGADPRLCCRIDRN